MPLRVIVAGDPTKPVFAFTIPHRLPRTLAIATLLCSAAAFLGGWRHAVPPGDSMFDSHAMATAEATEALVAKPQTAPAPEAPAAAAKAEPASAPTPSIVNAPAPSAAKGDPAPAVAKMDIASAKSEPERFTVEMVNGGKTFDVVLSGPAKEPDEASYRMLRHELRCLRTGAENPIDPRLVELLHQIAVRTGSRIQVVSAFRAPLYPRDLNYHVRGMAADIRVPGMSTIELRDLARSLGANGVGYYPTVQFVHVDVREVPYFWTDTSGHNENRHESPEDPNAPASSAEAPPGSAAAEVPQPGPTPSDLLPSVSSPPPSPIHTPAQSAADRLGLPFGR
ncbi:MAG TPA: DUF882 domain-containing protein [Polyangiaceae bacterium]